MGNVPLTQELHDAFCNDDNGTKLVRYFGKNTHILEEICSMGPSKQAMTLGKISERLSRVSNGNKKKKAVSSAPKPNTRLKSNSKSKKNFKKGMSMDDYVSMRRRKK